MIHSIIDDVSTTLLLVLYPKYKTEYFLCLKRAKFFLYKILSFRFTRLSKSEIPSHHNIVKGSRQAMSLNRYYGVWEFYHVYLSTYIEFLNQTYTGKIPTVCLHRHEEKLVMKRQCYYERRTVTLRHVTPAEPSQANRNSGIAQEACRKLIRILVLQT